MGQALARHLARAGHEVALSNSRGRDSLSDTVGELGDGVRAASTSEAVATGNVVFLALPYFAVERTGREAGPWDGKLVVDLTNYYGNRDGAELDPGEESSSVIVSRHLGGARVVKAFNTIWYRRLEDDARPDGGDRLAIPIAGDDPEAKERVAALVREIGFEPVDAGSLADGRRQQPGTAVYAEPLTPEQARERLDG
jgi:predicted dinucleotide-binding enzyme